MSHREHCASGSFGCGLATPVYSGYLADPFAWRCDGCYYMIGTGAPGRPEVGGRCFPMLTSRDFQTWDYCGHALVRPDAALGDTFWAPEVAQVGGKFYAYYSVGFEDTRHHLRVAVADSPKGPYVDSGVALTDLTRTPFAIDPSPFRDDDGQWYLFYARDFLDTDGGACAGTALAVDRLADMTTLAGEEQTVLRADHDWQRFKADRTMYGRRFDWHTVEGPFVWKRGSRYICFYSGGRWDSDRYGVGYAAADRVLGGYAEADPADVPAILRTAPGRPIGAGHNSVVVGPDGKTTHIVYHAWNEARTIRSPYISRLEWTSDDLPMPVSV